MRDLNIDPGQVEFLGPGELSRLRVDAARVGVLFSGIQRFRSIPYIRPAAPHLCYGKANSGMPNRRAIPERLQTKTNYAALSTSTDRRGNGPETLFPGGDYE